MQKLRLMLISLILMILMISISGCSIGIKEKQTIVYAGFAKTYEETQGAIQIATNRKIPVTIIGEKDINTQMDLGGMIVIRSEDLKLLIQMANKK